MLNYHVNFNSTEDFRPRVTDSLSTFSVNFEKIKPNGNVCVCVCVCVFSSGL